MLSDNVRTCRLALVLLCCATLILLALINSTVLNAYATSSLKEVHAPLLTTQTAPQECPDASMADPKGEPVLDFCSPKYAGNVNGPVGSHLVLLGQNFPAQPSVWVLTQNKSISLQDIQNCLVPGGPCTGTTILQNAAAPKSVGRGEYEFFWTWNPTNFPTIPQDYYFATELLQKNAPPKLVVSSAAFTLTSAFPACITVNSGNGGTNCSQPQSITLSSGSSLTFHGTNWLLKTAPNPPTLPPTPTVIFTVKCAVAQCGQNLLSQPLTIPIAPSGAFSQAVVLPKNVTGKYTICASYQVQNAPPLTQVVTPGQDFNTVILNTNAADVPFDGSLTFGCKGDTTALVLTVKSQPVPPPPPIGNYENVLNIVSYAGIVLAIPLLLLCLYFFLQGRQAPPQNSTMAGNRYITATNQEAVKRAVDGLVQGNPDLAVQLAKQAFTSHRVQWNSLLEVIEKVPRAAPASVGDAALNSLNRAKQDKQNALEHICKAVILYRWFLNNSVRSKSPEAAGYWYNLGLAYSDLSSIVPTMSTALLADALASYRIALSIYQPQGERDSCFATLRNMGDVYLTMSSLPEADQQVCLNAALSWYQDARSLTRDQKRKQEIQDRISRVEKELSVR